MSKMTKKEALTILNPSECQEKALKQAYRAAALKYHPDHGGDERLMKLVNLAFEVLKDGFWTPYEGRSAAKEVPLTEEVKAKWEEISHFPLIRAEIIGTWIWVSGQTWRYKKQLKALGFKWSYGKNAYYWHHYKGYRKLNGRQYDMDDIRSKFGSNDLQNTENRSIVR